MNTQILNVTNSPIFFQNNIEETEKKEKIFRNGQFLDWHSELIKDANLNNKNNLEDEKENQINLSNQTFIRSLEKNAFEKAAKNMGFSQIDKFEEIRQIRNRYQGEFFQAINQFQHEQVTSRQKQFNCTRQEAQYAYSYETILNVSSQIAYQVVKGLLIKLGAQTVGNLESLIKENKEAWDLQVIKNKRPVYIRSSVSPNCPVTLQYQGQGHIYLIFNKAKDFVIGRGVDKKVREALNLKTASLVARVTAPFEESLEKEYDIIRLFENCKGIVQMVPDTFLKYRSTKNFEEKIAYMQKYYRGGSLSHFLTKNNSSITLQDRFFMAKQILTGLSIVQSKNILHRDIKLDNILVGYDAGKKQIIDCVLADFGFACELKDKRARTTGPGTPLNMSPEYFLAKINGDQREIFYASHFANDNWGMGICLYSLFKPIILEWKDLPDEPYWFGVEETGWEFDDQCNYLVNEMENLKQDWLLRPAHPVGQIVCDLLQPDSQKRISAQEALNRLILSEKNQAISTN